jgi:cytoskeletal protein RodZ
MGCQLLNLLPENAVVGIEKPKHTMLPLLIVLFLISYGLLAMLVVEQAHTIDAQRTLIQQLFSDSVELTTLKGKAAQHNPHAKNGPKSQTPSPQVQAPPSKRETPSSQVDQGSKPSSQKGNRKLQKPEKPPTDASGIADERRNPSTI